MKKLIFYTAVHVALFIPLSGFGLGNPPPAVDDSSSNSGVTDQATGSYTQRIVDAAKKSSCINYSWKNRGRAPAGYIKGVSLSFARSICRLRASEPVSGIAKLSSAADSHDARKDAIAHYQSVFAALNMRTNGQGEDTLRALYTLGVGLGMRESSGAYCEGWDVSAGSNRTSAQAEAGLFQTSYDSMGVSAELKKLYQAYTAAPQLCLLNVFKEGASCKSQSILGNGAGATYQLFNKSCPAFATEYAMAMLRLQRSHYGPINRRDAEVIPACNSLLTQVSQIINQDPATACQEML